MLLLTIWREVGQRHRHRFPLVTSQRTGAANAVPGQQREFSMHRLMILSVATLLTVAMFAVTAGAALAEEIGGL